MLTNDEYNDLWNDQFAPIVPAGTVMPPYIEYAIRERMFQDYLDIFRGKNTRIEGFVMPYPHPFFNADGTPKLKIKPCIKYIMIGECALPLNRIIPVKRNCNIPNGDTNNTYFYNILHLGNTPYLNAPMRAFTCPDYRPCPENKIETLLCLASKGVLLIDIFPFAIDYNNLNINDQLILELFNSKINYINEVLCPYLCKDFIKFAFIGRMNHSILIIHNNPILNVCNLIINIDELSTVDFDPWLIRNGGIPSLGVLHGNWHPLTHNIAFFTDNLHVGNYKIHRYRVISKTRLGITYQPHEVNLRFTFDL
jgi:hypothetical protein